ncbi:MAG: hypothetical protein WCS77_01505 [Elusimicrobiaceae bacterium]
MAGYKHQCRYCGKLVQNDAKVCPACGKTRPTGPLRCPKCETPVEAVDKACGHCGLPLETVCAHCGNKTFFGDYCQSCGEKLEPPKRTGKNR